MKKQKLIIGILCLIGTYFTAHYGATTELGGMQVWSFFATVLLFIGGVALIVDSNY